MNLNIVSSGNTFNQALQDERLAPTKNNVAIFRFYAELNDFLPPERKQMAFAQIVNGRRSVKDIIESLGVPHTEIDILLANSESVDFSYRVKAGDRISVYPMFESMDIRPLLRVRPRPLRVTKFAVDSHLGRLARYLRMAGFDTYYENEATDEMLARTSSVEGRILLTQDRGLLKRSLVTHGYCVREALPLQQLAEVIRRFDLQSSMHPFRRCIPCNGLLEPVSKESILESLPPLIQQRHQEFHQCSSCGKLYWAGSHYQRMKILCQSLMNPAS
jgi:uncharacterized protein